ncbi:ketoacyl-synt-domain-containing protein [Xylariomycetidae sp. FL2044]|nr:ketoacyl-synt-domain-containing protein [Xylariomycetidae sp. FL2044]
MRLGSRLARLCSVLILALEPFLVSTTTLHMSPSGSDSNDGSSISKALKTLQGVLKRIQSIGPDDAADIVIAEGIYLSQSVTWTYFNGQPITFTSPEGAATKPTFDGEGTGLTWFTMQDGTGTTECTNLHFVGLAVTNYWLGLDLGRDKTPGNCLNEVRSMLFERVGAFYTHGLPNPKGYAALRLRQSSNNTITGNRFHGVKNSAAADSDGDGVNEDLTAYIHAIYMAHHSRGNIVSNNEFNQVTGDAVRTRDGSDDNLIEGNRFITAGKYSAYSDWIDDEGNECPSHDNQFLDNTVGAGYFGPFEEGFVTHTWGPDDRCSSGGTLPPRIIEIGTIPHEGNSNLEPIAICGMSCRLPGGVDSDSSFWQMIVEKRTGQTPRVPASRFNIDAHYHKDLERPGSFNILGGYFLDSRLQDFDPSFFNITPVEAQWLDPQQLEVCYECLVSAGVTLDAAYGSNTAVFVGSFTSDYQQMSTREPDFRHNYTATGVDTGIISNRIGHTFNLRGPSFTINTACSSSVYALHNACHALRARDCDAAIVGGVNLILTVDQHMNTAKLGILSPTSTCHTFDARADGYGRGEAAGALYVKRLSDAIRDGDPIRGVIRSTAVNTNGKEGDNGLTHPGLEGQERVLRMAYEKAGLNQNLTAYAELHGTGTPVGDPIEVLAVSRAMNDTRPKSQPLLMGGVKPNIGHSEAASGIFAVMKAALMTEAAIIPGVALLENLNPAIKEEEWNVKVHRETAPWPEDSIIRRASVSSFGYGGTNGHVVVESIESIYPWYQHGQAKDTAPYDHSCSRPLLVVHSAHDKTTLLRNVAAIAKVAPNYYLADLAHTLNLHRTKFKCRAFIVAREESAADAFDKEALTIGAISPKAKDIGFLFTGQGAQWAGMAKEAYRHFSAFSDVIQRLDLVLSRLDPPPEFSLATMLKEPTTEEAALINEPHVSQPICTAVQIALVDLLGLWNVTPRVSVGHSSGEIAAAYAAGLISAPEAIVASFCRGRAVKARSGSGSMLAVGLGVEQVRPYLQTGDGTSSRKICVACENSPNSVTLSGEVDEIIRVQKLISSEGIFARELKTGRAYHSPQMSAVGDYYDELLAKTAATFTASDLEWRRPRSYMVSSVTGDPIDTETLPPGYFSANLRNTVRFNTAVERVGADQETFGQVGQIIEIGPHAALSGPFKQICTANKFDRFTYVPSLERNKNDADQVLSVAGRLFLAGYPVDLEAVNAESYGRRPTSRPESSNMKDVVSGKGHKTRKPKTQYLLVDLPPYQWNYEKEYWTEPRASAEQRARLFPRHDLLGSRVSGLSGRTRVWRNLLRHRDVPWLQHHSLGGTAIFPAAGHLAVAIEALKQVHQEVGIAFDGARLRDVVIDKALAVPENDDGVEIVVTLRMSTSLTAATDPTTWWHGFSIESLAPGTGEWILHCTGNISAAQGPATPSPSLVDRSTLSKRASGKTWYEAFRRVGFNYGPTFQQLQHAQTDRGLHQAAGDVIVLETCEEGESRSLIHPSTVDACLQLAMISIHAGRHKTMPWGVVPTRIEEAIIYPAAGSEDDDVGSAGHAVAWADDFQASARHFNTHTTLTGKSGKLLVHLENLEFTAYEAAIPASTLQEADAALPRQPFSQPLWKPDISRLTAKKFRQKWPQLVATDTAGRYGRLAKFVELISHRQSLDSVLLLYGADTNVKESQLNAVCQDLPSHCAITLALCAPLELTHLHLSEETMARVTATLQLPPSSALMAEPDIIGTTHDLVLVDVGPETPSVHDLLSLVHTDGWVIGSSPTDVTSADVGHIDQRVVAPILQIYEEFAARNAEGRTRVAAPKTNGTSLDHNVNSAVLRGSDSARNIVHSGLEKITVLSLDKPGTAETDLIVNIAERLSGQLVSRKLLSEFQPSKDRRIIINDTGGRLLFSGMNEPNFIALKSVIASGAPIVWVTRGVRQGYNPTGGMAEGFLRVIRSEQAVARVMLLDVDNNERASDVADVMMDCLTSACTKDSGNDTEFWLHQGVAHIQRVQPNIHINEQWNWDDLALDVPQVASLSEEQSETTKVMDGAMIPTPPSSAEGDVLSGTAPLCLSGDDSYLLVGCLGGLGCSLTRFMMERGAKHFAFLSRSGADKGDAARLVESIREQDGCSADVFRVDASDEDTVCKVVEALHAKRPIKGVVHAAMVLRDGIFDTMDVEAFNAAVAPKARGALSLHNALQGIDLDFFVMTSSISAVLGNTGQNNYSAANSCLDALALHRNVLGLAGSSLVLPMVLDVGVVAEHDSDALETSLMRKGMYGIDEEEMLRGFEVAMLMPPSASTEAPQSQLIMGMDASELGKAVAKAGGLEKADVYWYHDARFCHTRAALQQRADTEGTLQGSVASGSFAEVLRAARAEGPEATLLAIARHIANRVSSILMIPLEEFEMDGRSIASYGLDSMIGAEMRTWLMREFSLDFPFQKLLDPKLTFTGLAAVAEGSVGG